MSQNIYDNPDFFAGYATLPRSAEGLNGAPEWTAMQTLLPSLAGKSVIDLGCGYGWFCRWAKEQGAARVTWFFPQNTRSTLLLSFRTGARTVRVIKPGRSISISRKASGSATGLPTVWKSSTVNYPPG